MSKTTPGEKYVPISLSCDKLKGEMYLIKEKDIDKCRDNAQDWKKYFKVCDASDKIDVKPKEFFKLLELSSTENNVLASLSPEEKIKNLFINKKVNLDSEDAEEESEAAEDTYQKVYSDIINRIHRLNVTHLHELDFKAYEKKKGEEKRIRKEQIDNFGLLPESPKTNIFTEAGIDFSNNQMTFVHPLYFYNHLKTACMLEFNPYAGKKYKEIVNGGSVDKSLDPNIEVLHNPGFTVNKGPINGYQDIIGFFMEHYDSSIDSRGYYHHAGIDFNGLHDFSSDVVSLITAEVVATGKHEDFGKFIICQNLFNNRQFYILGHLNRIDVKKYDIVNPGSALGKAGNTGKCYSTCGQVFSKSVRVENYPEYAAKGWGTHLHVQLVETNALSDFFTMPNKITNSNNNSYNPFRHNDKWSY